MLDEEERAAQSLIVLARRYYDGDHDVYLTDRQKAWLELHGSDVKFTVNHCPTVVDAVVERLSVTGFKLPDNQSELSTRLWQWWRLARMDAISSECHLQAVRDSEAFVIANWLPEEKRPEYILHPRYVDTLAGGDGFGMWMDYPDGNLFTKPEKANKRWSDHDEKGNARERLTVYYPERIEKFYLKSGKWEKLELEGEAWPLPWVTNQGRPIGIPVAHFFNPGLKSELRDIIPIQDAYNKEWLDLLAAGDTTAFRILVMLGFRPTTDGAEPKADGSNLLKVAPGQQIATTKGPGQADAKAIEAADLSSLLSLEERLVRTMATISDTPLSRFQISGQVAAEGTLKQQEGPLVSKVEKRQMLFGDSWEELERITMALSNAFGGTNDDTTLEIETQWKSAATRDDANEIKIAQGKKELGATREQVLSEVGYTAEQIKQMKADPDWNAKTATFFV